MNSAKSAVTVLFLLFVSYGVYRVIHTPDPLEVPGRFVTDKDSADESDAGINGSVANANSLDAPSADTIDFDRVLSSAVEKSVPFAAPPLTNSTTSAPQNSNPLPPPLVSQSSVAGTTKSIERDVSPIATTSESTSPGVSQVSALTPPIGNANAMLAPLRPNHGTGQNSMSGPLTNNNSLAPPPNVATPSSTQAPWATSESTPPSTNVAGTATMQPPPPASALDATWPTVDAHIRSGKVTAALRELSRFYHSDLSDAQRTELLQWLDALAFKVIYSTENRLAPMPYVVQDGDTLESISAEWQVPKELIANINRGKLPADGRFVAGLELKMIQGPFRAEVDTQRSELTLFLNDLYAGRFPIDTSHCRATAGTRLQIENMHLDSSGAGVTQMDLGQGECLVAAGSGTAAGMSLSAADAKDVFGILSQTSSVTIVR